MQIGIVGAGKVGCSLGKYLAESTACQRADIRITGYAGRSEESVESAATFTKTKAFDSVQQLVKKSDVLFITTPDDAIASVWEQLKKETIYGKIICHFSGSLSSELFSGREELGVSACSIHPMYAFSNKFTSYQQLNSVLFTMEGDKKALEQMSSLFHITGNEVCIISPDKKVTYHAAASMVSNMMIGLYEQSIRLLEDCGFEREAARTLVKPLVSGNVQSFLEKSPEEALTGPIERNDLETVRKHLSVLSGRQRELYVNLGWILTDLAKKKNPERDYKEMSQLFEE